MNEIANLIFQAQSMGIKIYPQNSQIHIEMPWNPEAIPGPARTILGEIKARKGELMVHFILTSSQLDIPMYLDTLKFYGVQLVPHPENGIDIQVPPQGIRRDDILIKLLDDPLRNYWHAILEYLNTHPIPAAVPG